MQPSETVTSSIGEETLLDRIEPQASTSALRLENGHDVLHDSTSYAEASVKPPKPWGLAEYGIPAPPSDLQPDPAVEVSS